MTKQNTTSTKVSAAEFDAESKSIDSFRQCLSIAGFELLKIWSFDDGRCQEIWATPADDRRAHINIMPSGDENTQEPDASRSQLISEVIDLWIELRGIRNLLSDDLDDFLIREEETPTERFINSVNDFQKDRENEPDMWNFMFSKDVDEEVCSFYALDECDRLAITH